MYGLIFSEKATKQLKKLERAIRLRIMAALERIRIRPEHYVAKLVGDPGYKLRVGDYRVIMDIDMSEIASRAHAPCFSSEKLAISEHAQEHAPGFTAVLDKGKLLILVVKAGHRRSIYG